MIKNNETEREMPEHIINAKNAELAKRYKKLRYLITQLIFQDNADYSNDYWEKELLSRLTTTKKGGNIMELSQKEKELYDFIAKRGEVTIKYIKDILGENSVGALGKLLRYEKIELSKNYNRRDAKNRVVKCYIVKTEEKEK